LLPPEPPEEVPGLAVVHPASARLLAAAIARMAAVRRWKKWEWIAVDVALFAVNSKLLIEIDRYAADGARTTLCSREHTPE
jgi:hypothetical protein